MVTIYSLSARIAYRLLAITVADMTTEDINADGAVDIVFTEKALYWWIQIHSDGSDEDKETFNKLVFFLQYPFAAGSFTK